jgi:hypothetical protein
MGLEVSKIFQANSGAVRGEVAAVNHAERTFLLAFENHATFEVAEAEVRAMLVDDAVGPLQNGRNCGLVRKPCSQAGDSRCS